MNSKQRILLIHNYYKIPGGEDTVVQNEKRLLEEHGHEVILYSRSNREMETFSAWQKCLLPFTSLFSLRSFREVKRLIRKEKIDIVHVHNTLNLVSPSVYYAAFACRVPVVQTIHNFRMLCPAATFLRNGQVCEDCVEQGLGCAVRHSCYRGSKAQTLAGAAILKVHRILGTYRKLSYICLTDFNREKLLLLNRKGKQIVDPEKVYVKPNFTADTQRQETVRTGSYLYVGRLEPLKGVRLLIEAWQAFPDKELLLCGIGPEEDWIRKYLEEHEMGQVKLLGQMPHEKVMELLGQVKALILPTLCYEGQPMVIMESYAAGTPVLASDIGNAGNMVLPGETGYRFRTGDPESLREAVRKLEAEPEREWKPREVYEQYYTPEKNYERLREIYSSVQGE